MVSTWPLLIIIFGVPFTNRPTQIISIVIVMASSILSLCAVFGFVWAGLFLNEAISAFQIVVIAIMLLGIHIIYTREKKIEVQY